MNNRKRWLCRLCSTPRAIRVYGSLCGAQYLRRNCEGCGGRGWVRGPEKRGRNLRGRWYRLTAVVEPLILQPWGRITIALDDVSQSAKKAADAFQRLAEANAASADSWKRELERMDR